MSLDRLVDNENKKPSARHDAAPEGVAQTLFNCPSLTSCFPFAASSFKDEEPKSVGGSRRGAGKCRACLGPYLYLGE